MSSHDSGEEANEKPASEAGSPERSLSDDQAPGCTDRNAPEPALYRNSLLAAIGYLDLANALDFPANVWNTIPTPLFAKVLMGLGGSIAILTTFFAFWDLRRSWENVKFLRQERAYLKQRRSEDAHVATIERAWLGINYRELGWEIIDRMMLDAFMAVAGILVGTGALMAIRGDIPVVFEVSNILSGYLGNSFIAAYAVVNTAWSIYMWRRAHVNDAAVSKRKEEIDPNIYTPLRRHARRHKIYAFANGVSILVSGVGSELSSTLWSGYVVLIPCIMGSVFCNYYWRHCLGYNRTSYASRKVSRDYDILERLRLLMAVRSEVTQDAKPEVAANCVVERRLEGLTPEQAIISFLQDFEADHLSRVGSKRLRDEERFLSELFGYYLREREDVKMAPSRSKETPAGD